MSAEGNERACDGGGGGCVRRAIVVADRWTGTGDATAAAAAVAGRLRTGDAGGPAAGRTGRGGGKRDSARARVVRSACAAVLPVVRVLSEAL